MGQTTPLFILLGTKQVPHGQSSPAIRTPVCSVYLLLHKKVLLTLFILLFQRAGQAPVPLHSESYFNMVVARSRMRPSQQGSIGYKQCTP